MTQNVHIAGKHFSTEISKHTKSHQDLYLLKKKMFTGFSFHFEWTCNFYMIEKKNSITTKEIRPLKNEFLILVIVVEPVQHRAAQCCFQKRVLPLQPPQEVTTVLVLRGHCQQAALTQQLGEPGEPAPGTSWAGKLQGCTTPSHIRVLTIPFPCLTKLMKNYCFCWEISNIILQKAAWQASLRREGQSSAEGVQSDVSCSNHSKAVTFNWGEIHSKTE